MFGNCSSLNMEGLQWNWVNCKILYRIPRLSGLELEAVVRMCSVKEVFLEISQNSMENTCARVSFLIKLQTRVSFLIKLHVSGLRKLWHRCFLLNFAKFLWAPFLTEHLRWLLLSNIKWNLENTGWHLVWSGILTTL